MSASEASPGFSALLEIVEQGEKVVLTRAGRRVAVIEPAPRGNGSRLQEVFDRWRESPALDDDCVDSIKSASMAASETVDADPWHE